MNLERIEVFLQNVTTLWAMSNLDQRIFLVTMICLAIGFLALSCYVAYWWWVNRHELKKVRHYTALRRYFIDTEPT